MPGKSSRGRVRGFDGFTSDRGARVAGIILSRTRTPNVPWLLQQRKARLLAQRAPSVPKGEVTTARNGSYACGE